MQRPFSACRVGIVFALWFAAGPIDPYPSNHARSAGLRHAVLTLLTMSRIVGVGEGPVGVSPPSRNPGFTADISAGSR